MHIYILNLTPLHTEDTFSKYFLSASEFKKKRIPCMKNKDDRIRSLGADILTAHGMSAYGISDYVLKTTDSGKPYMEGNDVFFSVSHSGSFAVAAFSRFPVGIDIEQNRKTDFRTAQRFFTENEVLSIENAADPDLEFLRIWTIKEAVTKIHGDNLLTTLKNFDTANTSFLSDGTAYKTCTITEKEYVLSFACAAEESFETPENVTLI